MNKPLLTVCLISYNQAKYIKEALEGILMQKVNFSWELAIADDCSTDGTREIIMEYKEKHPDLIQLILQEKNFGPEKNWLDLMSYPKSKYVLYAEGDDYFTDPDKLQKQVDFLEKNTELSMCFHPVKVIYEDGTMPDEIFPSSKKRFEKKILELEDLLKHNFIQTNSVMYRWRFIDENILDIFPKNIIPGDYFLHLLHAQKGKIGFIDEVMAVYRRHPGGIWFYTKKNSDELHLKHGIQQLNFLKNIHGTFLNNSDEYFKCKILPFATHLVNLYSVRKRPDKLEEFSNLFPEYYNIVKAENNSKSTGQLKKRTEEKNREMKFVKSSEFRGPGSFYVPAKSLIKKKIRNMPGFLRNIFKNKSDHDTPIFIISFNRKEQLKRSIDSYRKLNRKVDIIIHDNGSDHINVLEYLKELKKEGIKVVYSSKIGSSKEINNIKETVNDYFKNRKASNYVVTDPDIELLNVDDDILDLYEYLLKKYPKAVCVGPMLTIRDIPAKYSLRNHVFDLHIKQFWGKKPQKIIWNNKDVVMQFCPIDTTFAMYRKNFSFKRLNDGIRTYYPYEAHHLDWYTCDNEAMKEEKERYCSEAKSDVAHWNNKEYLEKFRGKNREKQKIYYVEKNNENKLVIRSEMI